MNESHYPIDEQLLMRYLKNELTDEERTAVETWLDASEDNRKQLKDYFHISWAATSFGTNKEKCTGKSTEKCKQTNKKIRKLSIASIIPTDGSHLIYTSITSIRLSFIPSRR
ncbi:MAG: hypothetical protein LIP01_03470 [Tannerellaceae bacterium]|nr:hypothetical protein [Tannerellaceae bacterium]